ncbi:hypothetical protein HPB49_025055 [Dermacentor silvarum]|uniref:Uncharacterized protein n=1 Tax=Dermacentor silvarum TaxID=543639 RepID=A0ACB8CU12_DERSI|nr:hypothetical protein HPB49_025055 [Dermacentor silvarum]
MARWHLDLIAIFLVSVRGFWTLPAPSEAGPVDYTGHRLVSVTPTTAVQVDALADLTHRLRLKDAVQEYAKQYDHVTYTTIGKSYEGRDLVAVHLATRYEKDEEIRRLVSAYEWRIHPVVNPDGYDYTHTKDRYWRKTRSKNGASEECLGADANRNFDTSEFCRTFDGQPSPSDPCSLTYCGDSAFSEVETRAIRDAVMATRNRTEFFFDVHSYGTMWMFPHGYTNALVPEYDQLLNISRRAAEAIKKVKGSVYRVGAMHETIYPMSGGSSDWAYDKAGVKKSFTIELQPAYAIFDADFGFLHPSKDIVSTATEAWEGIKAAVST